MGLRADFDIGGLIAKLSRTEERTSRSALQVLRGGANEIRDVARENAPVDEGPLEDAIEVVELRTGVRGRIEFVVQVNPTAVDKDGDSVAYYALIMHEMLQPYGSGGTMNFNLGPKSQEKDGGSGRVGGKFLERAVRKIVPKLQRDIQDALQRELK